VTKRFLVVIITTLLASAAYAADSQIWGEMIIPNILAYGKAQSTTLGPLFVTLQSEYFRMFFLVVLVCIPVVFAAHYVIWGPKVFSHDGEKIYVFTIFNRLVHLLAVIAFLILVPTGFMIAFGKYLGGGSLIMFARQLHGYATILFAISVIPMFLFWVIDMLPTWYDIKWFLILGGYLSKTKREVPAGKFNAGQKVWFWLATLGGVIMILTGAVMYLQDFNLGIASSLGLTQIDLLRIAAIIHNILAAATVALFFTHVYMSLFAIKGAVYSMINGYKEEDEVKHLHSFYYKKLQKQSKV